MLSKGIAEAMNNTAFGLTIAVVCIVAHLLLTSKAKAMVEDVEYNALRLENMLSRPLRLRRRVGQLAASARGTDAPSRPRWKSDTGELNIVPYLDVVVNLVMFMLLSMTGLISLGVLNVSAPRIGGEAAAAAASRAGPKLLLTVAIGRQGFYVAGAGGRARLGRQRPPTPPGRPPSRSRTASTTTRRSPTQLARIKEQYPRRDPGDPLGRPGRALRHRWSRPWTPAATWW